MWQIVVVTSIVLFFGNLACSYYYQIAVADDPQTMLITKTIKGGVILLVYVALSLLVQFGIGKIVYRFTNVIVA